MNNDITIKLTNLPVTGTFFALDHNGDLVNGGGTLWGKRYNEITDISWDLKIVGAPGLDTGNLRIALVYHDIQIEDFPPSGDQLRSVTIVNSHKIIYLSNPQKETDATMSTTSGSVSVDPITGVTSTTNEGFHLQTPLPLDLIGRVYLEIYTTYDLDSPNGITYPSTKMLLDAMISGTIVLKTENITDQISSTESFQISNASVTMSSNQIIEIGTIVLIVLAVVWKRIRSQSHIRR